ncbi:hypothetical protein Bca4012_069303 [Brassica carinata]
MNRVPKFPHNLHHLSHLVSVINVTLQTIQGWSLWHTAVERNSAAAAIATSVTTGLRYQSYVASKGPASRGSIVSFQLKLIHKLVTCSWPLPDGSSLGCSLSLITS